MKTININVRVKAKLTVEGCLRYYTYYAHVLAGTNLITPPLKGVERDIFESELWNFMQIFGPHLYMGSPQLIEKNELEIIERN